MKLILAILLVAMYTTNDIVAQIQQLNLTDQQFGCSYIGKPGSKNVYAFETNSEAVDIINEIVMQSGLEPNFKIYAADVSNAEARVINGERVIIYNQNFIHEVRNKTGSDWAATSILAHEIGHHLQGHTLKPGGSRPALELESDKWSGFILYKLGASLEQAQVAINELGSPVASATHPAKNDRLQAIAVGWTNARHIDKKSSDISSKTNSDIPAVKEKLSNTPPVNKPPSNSPPQIDQVYEPEYDEDDLDDFETRETYGLANRTNFYYLGNMLFTTQANVQILINGIWYTPPSNEFYIDNIPAKNQIYRVAGTLTISADLLGSYTVNIDNTGYIDVGENRNFYIIVDYNWLNEEFSVRISPTNY